MIYREIISEKKEEIATLELKDGASFRVGDKEFFGYLPLPILNSKLVTLVKGEIEEIPVEYFVEGMVYSLSMYPDGDYNDIYLDFIKTMTGDFKGYLFKNSLEKINEEDYSNALVYLDLLMQEKLDDEKVLFAIGQALENLDISTLSHEKKDQYALEIMNVYERVLNKNPKFSLAHYKLGYIYKEFGQFIKSKLTFEKFIQLDKNDFRIQEARNAIDEIEYEIKKEEAINLINSGSYEEALKKLLDVNIEGRDDLLFYHVSLCYVNLDEMDAALDAITKAIEIQDLGVYHNQLAIIYQRLGNVIEAKKEIEEAIDKFGPDYYLNFNLATIQYNQGEIEAALGNFEIAYELNPNTELGDIIEHISKGLEN